MTSLGKTLTRVLPYGNTDPKNQDEGVRQKTPNFCRLQKLQAWKKVKS